MSKRELRQAIYRHLDEAEKWVEYLLTKEDLNRDKAWTAIVHIERHVAAAASLAEMLARPIARVVRGLYVSCLPHPDALIGQHRTLTHEEAVRKLRAFREAIRRTRKIIRRGVVPTYAIRTEWLLPEGQVHFPPESEPVELAPEVAVFADLLDDLDVRRHVLLRRKGGRWRLARLHVGTPEEDGPVVSDDVPPVKLPEGEGPPKSLDQLIDKLLHVALYVREQEARKRRRRLRVVTPE